LHRTPILLVATETRWIGVARTPRALHRAGFEVFLLAPRGSLGEKTRYVSGVVHLPDGATAPQWLHAFASTVDAVRPRLVVPADDAAFRLLQNVVVAPPAELPAADRLAALVRDSLGDPAGYRASVEKTRLPDAARRIGVPMPASIVARHGTAASAFADAHGYPVVLKRDHSSAGDGVRICRGPSELHDAFTGLLRPHAADFAGVAPELLVQQFIDGPIKNYAMCAWKGGILTSYAGLRIEMNPPRSGPPTVTNYHRDDALRDLATRLVAGLGMTGLLALECIVNRATGTPYLLEVNRRLVPGGHRGSDFDVDHCAALFAAVHGLPQRTRTTLDPGEEHLSVHFPQEWLRDPKSRWLVEHPVDVPWDDPALIRAMLAMRHE